MNFNNYYKEPERSKYIRLNTRNQKKVGGEEKWLYLHTEMGQLHVGSCKQIRLRRPGVKQFGKVR